MTTDSKKILIVEGDTDTGFFKEICNKLNLGTTVKIAPPKGFCGHKNGKNSVIKQLKEYLLPSMPDGRITNIGVIVDADYVKHRNGYTATLGVISQVVAPFGFTLETGQNVTNGLFFKHNDGLADLGLWIMPNNQQEGMLEDWIKSCVSETEQALFQQAIQAVHQIATPKFKPHLYSKAEVATWLAWQKEPGHGLYYLITESLLNRQHHLFVELEQWLIKVFADLPE